MKRLSTSFFNRSTLLVAEELLGKVLVFKQHRGIITETEAYLGFDDPASHAFRGETPRTKIMFGKPGFSYVYLIYGMYHCLNVVTEQAGFPAAVLIRGIRLLDNSNLHLDGPGKLCKHLGITKAHNEINLTSDPEFYFGSIQGSDDQSSSLPRKWTVRKTPRIGIKVGKDKLWRFVAE